MTNQWAIYIRVSSDEQAEEGASIPAQLESCEAYAKARGRHVPRDLIIIDDGYTGRNDRRPGFQRLLGLLRERQVVGFIAWKLKRIARSTRIIADLLDLLKRTQTDFTCVTESWDTTTPMGVAMINVGGIFAQLDSDENGVQTSLAMQYLRKHGFWTGGTVPPGTSVQTEGFRKKLVENEHAPIVREAWAWVLQGQSLREIGNRLTQSGVPCTSRKQPLSQWTPVQVRNFLLSSQVVPLLVDAGTQLAVKHRLSTRSSPIRRGTQTPGLRTAAPSPLAGMLRCPACDAAMVQTTGTGRHGGTYRYFRCTNKPKLRCSQKDVRCDQVEQVVMDAVREACQAGGEYQRILRAELAAAQAKLEQKRGEQVQLKAEREQLAARVADLTLRQQIGTAVWNEAMKALGGELERVDRRLAELTGTIAVAEVDRGSLDLVLADIAAHTGKLAQLPPDEQGKALRVLLDRVRLEDESVILDLYHPQSPNEKPAGITRRGSYSSASWLPGSHGVRTLRIVIPRALLVRPPALAGRHP